MSSYKSHDASPELAPFAGRNQVPLPGGYFTKVFADNAAKLCDCYLLLTAAIHAVIRVSVQYGKSRQRAS